MYGPLSWLFSSHPTRLLLGCRRFGAWKLFPSIKVQAGDGCALSWTVCFRTLDESDAQSKVEIGAEAFGPRIATAISCRRRPARREGGNSRKKKNPSNGHKAGVGGNRGRLAARLHRSVCNCVWNSGTVSCTRHQHQDHVHATCKYSTKFFLLACYTRVYAATSRGRQLLILRCGYGDA